MNDPESACRSSQSGHEEEHVSCFNLFWTFFRIGLMTFGGGFAMAMVVRHELVLKRRWLSDGDFVSSLSTATIVPGAIAVNLAFLQGRRFRGLSGAVAAVLGAVFPSFFVILLVLWFALPYFEHPGVAAFLKGCAIAVSGQIAFAAWAYARALRRYWWKAFACVLGMVILLLGLHPIWAITAAAVVCYTLQLPGRSFRGNSAGTRQDG